MNSWRPYPFVRLVLPLLAGMIAGIMFEAGPPRTLAIILLLSILILLFRLLPRLIPGYGIRWLPGFIGQLFIGITGFVLVSQHTITNDPLYPEIPPSGTILCRVSEPPSETASGWKAVLEMHHMVCDGKLKPIKGNGLAYMARKTCGRDILFGDLVLVHGEWELVPCNANPHAFDYARYLRNKGITFRTWARSWEWDFVIHQGKPGVRAMAFRCRDRLLEVLKGNGLQGDEFAVAAALLLGYTQDLGSGLMKDYSATGAMHILSVSGMHVGIIYLFLEFMLGFLNRNSVTRWIKALLLLGTIWFYALLTGLSPCVFRSAAMLTLPILAKTFSRDADMFNVIAVSLFLLLLVDPFFLPDIGFQLSYLAVTGLVVLYKPIYDLYVTSRWIPDKIWALIAVAIAAQLATLPLTLYVFHQFPNYFMATNIVIVPLSSLVIYTGIAVMAFSGWPFLSVLLAKGLSLLIYAMNGILHYLGNLPGATVSGIHISLSEMLLLYVIILSSYLFLTLKKSAWLFLLLITLVTLACFITISRSSQREEARFTVWNARQSTLFGFTCGHRALIVYEHGSGSDLPDLAGILAPARSGLDARNISLCITVRAGGASSVGPHSFPLVPVARSGIFFAFRGLRVAVIDRPPPAGLKVILRQDYVILRGNPRVTLARVKELFSPTMIIADGANSRYSLRKWQSEASAAGISFHATPVNGAFEAVIGEKFSRR